MRDWIVYEDEKILVVHKPAGLAVQNRSFGRQDLESMLKNYLKEKEKGPENRIPYLGIVHRLDQPVEGLLVFARDKKTAGDLSRQITEGKMEKRYLAIVQGIPESTEEVFLKDWIVRDGKTRMARIANRGESGAGEARLSYRLLKQWDQEALVEIHLDTGRFHQIRVQMAHAGLPLAGDRKYNPGGGEGSLALCAYALAFHYPGNQKRMFFELPKSKLQRFYRE